MQVASDTLAAGTQVSASLILPLVSARDVCELAQALMAAVDTLIPCDNTGFYFLNPKTYQLDLVFAKGFSEVERAEAQASMDRRHPGWVVRHRKALYVPDTDADPLLSQNPLPRMSHIRSRFYVPLVCEDQCVGALGIASRTPNAFSDEHRAQFALLGEFTAQAHARLVETEQLRQSRRQLETAISAAEEGLWEWDIPSGIVRFSSTWQTMLGYAPDELPHREETFFRLLHPDDVPLVSAALRAHFQDNVPYAMEVRMKRRDDTYAWILARGQALHDATTGEVRTMSGTHVDLTSLKAAQESMREARDAALAASQLKSAFVANMSHEIRTPMNGVIGLTYLLLDTNLDAQQREYTTLIRSSAEALLGVLNDVLDFSKVESGRLDVQRQPLSLNTLVDEAIAGSSGIATAKGLRIVNELSGEPLLVTGDRLRVRQILMNLLGNALKFTERGQVVVRVSQNGRHMVRVEVQDTGIGVAPEAAAHIFQPFRQADGSTTRNQGGTGLGLAISRQLAELMGGAIGYERPKGGGSTFWFEMPAVASLRPQRLGRNVWTLDSDVIELRLLRAVTGGEPVHRLMRLEDLARLMPPPDLLIVAGSAVKPEELEAAIGTMDEHAPRPEVVVRTSDATTAQAFAARGFQRVVASVRELSR